MRLMTKELEEKIPRLYETDDQGMEAVAHVHYFNASWDWYVTEYDPEHREAFGFVVSPITREQMPYGGELGYFTIDELESVGKACPFDAVERDLYFEPTTLKEIADEIGIEHAAPTDIGA